MPKAKKSAAPAPEAAPTNVTGTPSASTAPVAADVAGKAAKGTKAGGKKKQAASTRPTAPAAGVPLIDTSLAAANAARMIGAKVAPPVTGETRAVSSTFKHLKESFTKPAGSGINSFLNSTASAASKKSNAPFAGNPMKQSGRNQTFGDVTRSNLPRRTGG